MHRSLIATVVLCALLGSAASFAVAGESAFPYQVRIATSAAALRCGPGPDFYTTQRPAEGEVLEVYRQAPGGWLAVRPTSKSASLVAARYVESTEEADVVQVVDDHAVSWVSNADSTSDDLRWQIRLKPDERLVVLGEETRRTFPGGPRELYFRIAPPAGEFRWIHETDVRHASYVRNDDRVSNGSVKLTDFRVVVDDAVAETPRDRFVARRVRATSATEQVVRANASEQATDDQAPDEQVIDEQVIVRSETVRTGRAETQRAKTQRAETQRAETQRAETQRAETGSEHAESGRANRRPRLASLAPRETSHLRPADLTPLDSVSFEKRFRELDVQLSLMVAKPVEVWNLDELAIDVDQLVGQGGTTFDRGRAQRLAEKMDEFSQFQARYLTDASGWKTLDGSLDGSLDGAPNGPLPGGQLAASAVAPTPAPAPAGPPGLNPRFDGSGWLYPVHSRNQASPPYALLDADGAILQFVSPAPGLNLHRYLRSEIGVFGQQATSSRLDKPHVTAQRVVSLKRHRR